MNSDSSSSSSSFAASSSPASKAPTEEEVAAAAEKALALQQVEQAAVIAALAAVARAQEIEANTVVILAELKADRISKTAICKAATEASTHATINLVTVKQNISSTPEEISLAESNVLTTKSFEFAAKIKYLALTPEVSLLEKLTVAADSCKHDILVAEASALVVNAEKAVDFAEEKSNEVSEEDLNKALANYTAALKEVVNPAKNKLERANYDIRKASKYTIPMWAYSEYIKESAHQSPEVLVTLQTKQEEYNKVMVDNLEKVKEKFSNRIPEYMDEGKEESDESIAARKAVMKTASRAKADEWGARKRARDNDPSNSKITKSYIESAAKISKKAAAYAAYGKASKLSKVGKKFDSQPGEGDSSSVAAN